MLVKGGVFKATHGLYDQFGEDRALDTPLAESAIAGLQLVQQCMECVQSLKCSLRISSCQQ